MAANKLPRIPLVTFWRVDIGDLVARRGDLAYQFPIVDLLLENFADDLHGEGADYCPPQLLADGPWSLVRRNTRTKALRSAASASGN